MTREEAIEELKEIRFNLNYKVNGTSRFDEALDMAIKALEQETCETCVYYHPDGYCRHSSLTIAEVE